MLSCKAFLVHQFLPPPLLLLLTGRPNYCVVLHQHRFLELMLMLLQLDRYLCRQQLLLLLKLML